MYKVYGNVLSTGTKERTIEVLGGYDHARLCVLVVCYSIYNSMDDFMMSNSLLLHYCVVYWRDYDIYMYTVYSSYM